MSEWLLLPDSVGPWPCIGSPPPESMATCRGFCIDISSVGFWPLPWSLRKQQIKPRLLDGETEPLTWAFLRACSSRPSDLPSHFHSHELGNLLALSLWNTIDLRHLNRDKPYFSFILISGLFQTIEGLSHSRKPEKPSRKYRKDVLLLFPPFVLYSIWGPATQLPYKNTHGDLLFLMNAGLSLTDFQSAFLP